MHRAYPEKTNPLLLNHLILTGKLHTYLANLDAQAKERYRLLIQQIAAAGGVTEDLKRRPQREWIKDMDSILNRVKEDLDYVKNSQGKTLTVFRYSIHKQAGIYLIYYITYERVKESLGSISFLYFFIWFEYF